MRPEFSIEHTEDLQVAEDFKRPQSPEINLWTKVLLDGITCFLAGPKVPYRCADKWLADAYWIFKTGDADRAGTFTWICNSLGIDADYLRKRVVSRYPMRNRIMDIRHFQ